MLADPNARLQVLAAMRLRALVYTRLYEELLDEPIDNLTLEHAGRIIKEQMDVWRAEYSYVPDFQDQLLYNVAPKISQDHNRLLLTPTPEVHALMQGQARVNLYQGAA